MQDSHLIQLFAQLNASERLALRKWLDSPMHNQREDVRDLYAFLEKNEGKTKRLTKEKAWKSVFPKMEYEEAKMGHLMSFLLAQMKQFLAYAEWQSDAPEVQLRLIQALRARNAPAKLVQQELDKGAKLLEAETYRDAKHHLLNMQLQRERYEQSALLRRDPSLPLAMHTAALETGFLLHLLRHACIMQNFKNVLKEPEENALISGVLGLVTEAHLQDPLVRLYFNLHRCLSLPDSEAEFAAVQADLFEHGALLREKERRDLYLLTINYCIRRINQGQQQYWQSAFDLYNRGLENRSLFEEGVLSKFTYANAVSVGMGLKNFAWVRRFLDDYRPFLPEKERDSVYHYSLAVYYFRLPDYDAAMDLLSRVEIDHDRLAQLNARTMLLRIYFEKGYTDALESLLDSFSVFLRRQKNLGYQREHYRRLIRFVRRLLSISASDKMTLQQLKAEILEAKNVAEKEWLLGSLESDFAV